MNVDDIRLDSSLDWRSAARARGVVCKLVDRGSASSSAGASAGFVCVSEYPCQVYSLLFLGVLRASHWSLVTRVHSTKF